MEDDIGVPQFIAAVCKFGRGTVETNEKEEVNGKWKRLRINSNCNGSRAAASVCRVGEVWIINNRD